MVYSICKKILVCNKVSCDCQHLSFLTLFNSLITSTSGVVEGMVAKWLVCWTLDQAVQVQALTGALHCVLGQDTLLS